MRRTETNESGAHGPSKRPEKSRISILRGIACASVFASVAAGLIFATGTGTPSSMGLGTVAEICPVGALESVLGSGTLAPRLLIALAIAAALVLVAGKAFCSWVCPVPRIQDLFKNKKRRRAEQCERDEASRKSVKAWRGGASPGKRKVQLDTRHAVLGGTLLTTAVFGFPVFCIICPVGLTFATFILLWRFIQFNEPTWGIIVFPTIIILETVALRKWCGKVCPIGALLSLLSGFNRTFRPTVDHKLCLRDVSGSACKACSDACSELIDPFNNQGARPINECVKCHKCADSCPAAAITFPFLGKQVAGSDVDCSSDKTAAT